MYESVQFPAPYCIDQSSHIGQQVDQKQRDLFHNCQSRIGAAPGRHIVPMHDYQHIAYAASDIFFHRTKAGKSFKVAQTPGFWTSRV